MKKAVFLILLSFLIFDISYSQNRRLQKAEHYYQVGEYTKALKLYRKVYAKVKTRAEKAELSFKIGIIAGKLGNPRLQILWFRKAIGYRYQNPKVYLYLGDAYRNIGVYQGAKDYYQKYLELVPDDSLGQLGIKACDLAQQWMKKPSRYNVQWLRRINSRYNDFAPAVGNDTTLLYFTSTHPSSKGKKINPNSGTYFADIYFAQKDKKGEWSSPQLLNGDVNTDADEGSCYVTPDGLTMYFTRCQSEKNANLGCKIYVAYLKDGRWETDHQLHLFADSSISVGQPWLTADGLTMYFVSDNPNGVGGKDIWVVHRHSKAAQWGVPQPLSKEINTPGDEIFPSLDKEGNLYFASNGHLGMGGFDIFKATKDKNGHWHVENLKYPINSFGNDYGICFISDKAGYLASNRNMRYGDDIFYFWIRPTRILLAGTIINDKTKIPVSYAQVELQGSDGTNRRVKTDYDGVFKIELNENTDYFLIAEKDGFLRAKTSISTKGIKNDTTLKVQIFIKPIDQIVQIPDIRYNYNDTTLRPESKVALDQLIELLRLNPDIKIEIMAHTDYRGTNEYNLKLSQGRANSVVAYLIKHGISPKRLVAKGYGEEKPFVVDKETARKYPFLKVGQVLSQQFIESLPDKDKQEICNELNRRTEFRVIGKIQQYQKFGGVPAVVDTTQQNNTPQN